jgi:hypothetical protein
MNGRINALLVALAVGAVSIQTQAQNGDRPVQGAIYTTDQRQSVTMLPLSLPGFSLRPAASRGVGINRRARAAGWPSPGGLNIATPGHLTKWLSSTGQLGRFNCF